MLGIVFEWLKLLQAKQRQRELMIRAHQIRTICPQSETATLLSRRDGNAQRPKKLTRVCFKIWDIFLWLNMQILGYILMLVVMLYNGWLVISLIAGSTIGYFMFGTSFVKINVQNCKTVTETFCYSACGDSETSNETARSSLPSTSASTPSNESEVTVCIHSTPKEIIA
ncbi:hypothetical protein RN001_004471 [Aquatica leii]|uniref:Copper transport protein n=1 Tax=Aquatica leii TaxID=1421715 RepID=A0AAN7PZZ2_9COLE|nr:hypothetical protein RN001_004471 [Aquatica leii]